VNSLLDDSQLLSIAGALVIAWLTYKLGMEGGRRRADEEHLKRRRQLATAFLFELRTLENLLRRIATDTKPLDAEWVIPAHLMDSLKADAILLSPETVSAFFGFYGLLSDIAVYRTRHGATEKSTDLHQFIVRGKAIFALKKIPQLKDCLEKEGGHLPDALPAETIIYPNLPAIPDRVFSGGVEYDETGNIKSPVVVESSSH
jgi:hypothetical protein